MYNNIDELVQAIWLKMNGRPAQEIKDDPELVRLFALFTMYQSALEEAKQYGWIGVGCITFAENRLRDAQAVTNSSGSDELRSYQQLPLIHDAGIRGFDECGHYGEQNPPVHWYDDKG